MAEKAKTPKKLRLLNIAKVVGVCIGGVFGLIAISLGIVALAGGFSPKRVELQNFKFEQNVYVIDGNLEQTFKQDGTVYHIDYQTKVDENDKPIYQTIKAVPTNADCTELDATLKIINGRSLQLVPDENTKIFGQTDNQSQGEQEEQTQNVWHDKYSIKLNSNIKVAPTKETKTFVDVEGNTFERDVNIGGWTLLQIEQGLHIAYCYVFVDVPVYDYQIVVESQNGLTPYQPAEDESEEETESESAEDFVPNYIVDNTNSNGNQYSFTIKHGAMIPSTSFDTIYSSNPSQNNPNISLGFVVADEIERLYPQRFKQVIYKSSDETVATITQNDDNTATITIMPNSYGKTFEISSYVVSIYNDESKIPQLDEYKLIYPQGEAEEKYNQDFDKIRKFSLNTIKFRVNELKLDTFEVSHSAVNYYVFDQSNINLTRDGSSNPNTKVDQQSVFNFSIAMNQHFVGEQTRLDEILNNISVSAVYKNPQGEYVEYEEDGAVFVQVDNFGAKKLVVNKQDSHLSYLKFEYKPTEESEGYIDYCPIQILVRETSLSINKSVLVLNYFKKPVESEIGDNINNQTNIELELQPTLSSQNPTYSKIMYFINFASDAKFVEIDESQKISIGEEEFFALSVDQGEGEDVVKLNNIIKLIDSGANAKLVVAIVKTSLPNGLGNIMIDDEYIQYYAVATNLSNVPQYVSVSSEEQFEIDKCVLVLGKDLNDINLDIEEPSAGTYDLYNDLDNPVIALSKLDLENNDTYATFVMRYYGTKIDNTNFFADFSKLNGVVTYAEKSGTEPGIFCLTFTAITNGTAIVKFNANSNPVWSKTITFHVTDDIITTLEMSNNSAVDNIIDAGYVVSSDKITFNDVTFDVTINPSDSQASSTSPRAFTLTQTFKQSLCAELGIDASTATLKQIVSKLNQNDAVRKSLGDLAGDANVVDILEYESLDQQLIAKIVSAGDALVVMFARTNGEVSLASEAYIIKVPSFELSSNFEQDVIYKTIGNVNEYLVRIDDGMNDNVSASSTETSWNIDANCEFTLNGSAIDFSALKFAFENGQTTSQNGSRISGDGIITFGAVPAKLTEKLYAYIGNSLTSYFCKFEMRFVLDPAYQTTKLIQSFNVNSGEYVDLFDLTQMEINDTLQTVPAIIVTININGNKLFLPQNYDNSKIEQFGQDFLQQFYYSDVGGAQYYHIYKTLIYKGEIVSGNVGGPVKFTQSGTVDIVSKGCVVEKITVNVSDAQPQQPDPIVEEPIEIEPNFTNIVFEEQDVDINQHIAFTPNTADVQVTSITFDVDGLNSNQLSNVTITFTEQNGILSANVDYVGYPLTYDLFSISESQGSYTLSKASGYDEAKSTLAYLGINQFSFNLIVEFEFQSQANSSNLQVTVSL